MKKKAVGLRSAEIVDGDLVLTLNNTMAAIEEGRQAILRHLEGHALDPLVTNRVEVVFEEIVSNTIRHGFSPGSAQSIRVRVAPRPLAIELAFEDDGLAFNPLDVSQPAPFRSLETAQLGGLGVSLVRKLSAAIRYERPPRARGGAFQPTNRLTVTLAR